jgi:peptide methionine sulfoxide reductase msrA/msrB
MKHTGLFMIILTISLTGCGQHVQKTDSTAMENKNLTPEEARVILHKGTERPYTGQYYDFYEKGTYVCRNCGTPLYNSSDKFKSDCGWPSFDDEIPGAVKRIPDADGQRTEIVCAHCGGHLGHVFTGEGFTVKNTRHCVNSVSLKFVPAEKSEQANDTAIFAGGCFWGVEYYMQKIDGVISTEVGYTDGKGDNPTYQQVCSHQTGFAEAVLVVFDPKKTSFETVARMFFEIHDPTQVDSQGPDVGDQYRSAIFYKNEEQKLTAIKLIKLLQDKGYQVATELVPATRFWKAEDYHQDYYNKKHGEPYCHGYVKRF